MASQNAGPIDQNDINGWVARFNTELGRLGESLGSQSGPQAQSWTAGLFDCFNPIDLCLISWCIPCVTFGKTHHRTEKESNMSTYSPINTSCLMFCGTSCFGLQWIPATMQRSEIRRKHNLEGSCLGDLFLSCCCLCCSLTQQEKETEALLAKPSAKEEQYHAEGQMNYATK